VGVAPTTPNGVGPAGAGAGAGAGTGTGAGAAPEPWALVVVASSPEAVTTWPRVADGAAATPATPATVLGARLLDVTSSPAHFRTLLQGAPTVGVPHDPAGLAHCLPVPHPKNGAALGVLSTGFERHGHSGEAEEVHGRGRALLPVEVQVLNKLAALAGTALTAVMLDERRRRRIREGGETDEERAARLARQAETQAAERRALEAQLTPPDNKTFVNAISELKTYRNTGRSVLALMLALLALLGDNDLLSELDEDHLGLAVPPNDLSASTNVHGEDTSEVLPGGPVTGRAAALWARVLPRLVAGGGGDSDIINRLLAGRPFALDGTPAARERLAAFAVAKRVLSEWSLADAKFASAAAATVHEFVSVMVATQDTLNHRAVIELAAEEQVSEEEAEATLQESHALERRRANGRPPPPGNAKPATPAKPGAPAAAAAAAAALVSVDQADRGAGAGEFDPKRHYPPLRLLPPTAAQAAAQQAAEAEAARRWAADTKRGGAKGSSRTSV